MRERAAPRNNRDVRGREFDDRREAPRNNRDARGREFDDRREAPRKSMDERRREIEDRMDAKRREIEDRMDAKRREIEDRMDAKRRELGIGDQQEARRDGKDGRRREFEEQAETAFHICPSCHSENPQHASFCLNCGGGFDIDLNQQSAPQQEQQPQALEMSNCPACKASLIGVTGNICPYCRSAVR